MDIHTACWEGSLDIVMTLLNDALRSHPPNSNDTTGSSASSTLYSSSSVSISSASSSSSSTRRSPAYLLATAIDTTPDGHRNTPLHYAAYNGHLSIVEYLITVIHVPIDPLNENNVTPLFYACQMNRSTVVPYLLSHGADPCIQEKTMNYCPADVTDNPSILQSMVGSARHRGILYGRPNRLSRPTVVSPSYLPRSPSSYGSKPYITPSLTEQNIHQHVYIHDSPLAVRIQWDPTDGRKIRQLKDLLLFFSPENALATTGGTGTKDSVKHEELIVKPLLTHNDTNKSKEVDTSLLSYTDNYTKNLKDSNEETNDKQENLLPSRSKETNDKQENLPPTTSSSKNDYDDDNDDNDSDDTDTTTDHDTVHDKGVPSLALIPVPLSHIDIGVLDVTDASSQALPRIVQRIRIPYTKAIEANHTWSLDGLPRGTGRTYVVKVRAVNAFGPGKWSLPSQPLIMESFTSRIYMDNPRTTTPSTTITIPTVEASIAWAMEAANFPQHAKRIPPPVPSKSIAKEFRTDRVPPWVFEPRQTVNSVSLRSIALTNAKYAGYKGMSINAPPVPADSNEESIATGTTLYAPGEVPLPSVPLEMSNTMKCNKNRDIKRNKPYKIYEKPPSIGHGLPASSPVAFEESNSMKNKGNPFGYFAGPHVEYGEATTNISANMENDEDEEKAKKKKTNKPTKKLASTRAYINYGTLDNTEAKEAASAVVEKPKVWFTFDEYVEAATEEANEIEAQRIKKEYEEEQTKLRHFEAEQSAIPKEPEIYTRKATGVGTDRSAVPPIEPIREYSARKPIYIEGEEPIEEPVEEPITVPDSPSPDTFHNMSPLTKRIGKTRTVIDSGSTGIGKLLATAIQNKEALATAALVTKFLPSYNPEINLDQATMDAREAMDAAVQARGSPRLISPTRKERQRSVANLNGQITLGGIAGALQDGPSAVAHTSVERTASHPGLFNRVTRPLVTSTRIREEAAQQRVQQVLDRLDDEQRQATLRKYGVTDPEDTASTNIYPRDSVVDKLLAAYSSSYVPSSTATAKTTARNGTKPYVKKADTAFTPAAGKMDSKVQALLPKGPTAYAYMHGLVPSTKTRGSVANTGSSKKGHGTL